MPRTEAKNARRIIQRTGVELSRLWTVSRAEGGRLKEDVKKITFEAGMCMKTNKTATLCPPRITRFLPDLTEFAGVLCTPWPRLAERRRCQENYVQSWNVYENKQNSNNVLTQNSEFPPRSNGIFGHFARTLAQFCAAPCALRRRSCAGECNRPCKS